MMRMLVLLPDRNSHDPDGTERTDWSGAFRVEAERLVALYGGRAVQIDVSQHEAKRRAQVRAALAQAREEGPLDLVALLCHGWATGISLGYHPAEVDELAEALLTASAPGAAFVLYACGTEVCEPGTLCAEPSGFAAELHQALVRRGGAFHLDAHAWSAGGGHCCSNPLVVRAEGTQLGAQVGWLIAPDSPLWPLWKARLADRKRSTLRLRYPLLSREQLEQELRST